MPVDELFRNEHGSPRLRGFWHGFAGLAALLAWHAPAQAADYGNIPLSFERNQGQTAAEVRYLARGDGSTLYLTCSDAVVQLSGPGKSTTGKSITDSQSAAAAAGSPASPNRVLRLSFGAARSECAAEGLDAHPGRAHYFLGRSAQDWITEVPLYGKVRYDQVYAGIDLIFYGNQGRIEYDFVVAAGADPSQIRLKIDGADKLEIDGTGNLVAALGSEQVTQHRPLIYQTRESAAAGLDPEREIVAGSWKLLAENAVGFELGDYDRGRPLVIDPVIVYSTFVGGSTVTRGFDIAVDSQGSAVIVGETTALDFPVTEGVAQPAYAGGTRSGFIVKLNPAGNQLVFATYLGGMGLDQALGVDVDPQGNIYVAGSARSSDFPVVLGSFDTVPGGDAAFVAKLPPDGSRLIYSTFLGDGGDDAMGIAADDDGSVCVVGETISAAFPLENPIQRERISPRDAFIAKLNPAGSALVFSTYFGGAGGRSHGEACAFDADHNVYVTGHIETDGSVMTTPGAFQTMSAGNRDAFVLKLNSEGELIYSTMFGGSNADWGYDIAVDFAGHAYVAGQTSTTDGSFPVTAGALRETPRSAEGFVTKFSPNGGELIYSTFIGGNGNVEPLQGIAVDTAGHAYVAGETNQLPSIETVNAIPGAQGEGNSTNQSAIFAKLSVDGSRALVLTPFGGGDSSENSYGIGIDQNCQAYITGETDSKDFVTVNPVQGQSRSPSGTADGFLIKIDPAIDDGEPAIGCRGVVAAPLTPVFRDGTANSIMTVYGSNFAPQGTQALVPEVDANGRVSTRLANTCVEVNGIRAPIFVVYAVAPNPHQINFQNPHQIGPGYASYRVISGCGTANERVSEPEHILIREAAPAFFNAVNNANGVNPIAALHQDNVSRVGPPGLFATVETTPARPGEVVSLYGTGFGATDPAFEAGELPGGSQLTTADVQVTLGGVALAPADILYIGNAPGNAGLYQLVLRIPANTASGNLAVVLTIRGRSTPAGPFLAVQAP